MQRFPRPSLRILRVNTNYMTIRTYLYLFEIRSSSRHPLAYL
jgi:hypothetical protein